MKRFWFRVVFFLVVDGGFLVYVLAAHLGAFAVSLCLTVLAAFLLFDGFRVTAAWRYTQRRSK